MSLRADSRRQNSGGSSQWLREYGGGCGQTENPRNNSPRNTRDNPAGARSDFRDVELGSVGPHLKSNLALNVVMHG